MLVSVLLHVIVFFALDQVKFVLGIKDSGEIQTRAVVTRQPSEEMPTLDLTPTPPPDNIVQPPKDTAKLIDDIELLNAVKDQPIDLSTQITNPEYALAMAPAPAASGTPDGVTMKDVAGTIGDFNDLPEPGRTKDDLKPAAVGQMTVDPGSMTNNDSDLVKFTDDMIKRGANGNAPNGTLDGITSLDDLIGLPSNELIGKKTMLPSDLLFEFNKYELRESAKFGLQKLGLLIDNNSEMYCWIEGHTDLIGSDAANLELSKKRAEAVKNYLVNSMGMDGGKIATRGYGEYQPIVTSGDQVQQGPNRRVEIKMRNTPPTDEQIKIAPPKAEPAIVEEMPPAPPAAQQQPMTRQEPEPTAPPKATLVRPNPQRGIPVEVIEMPPATSPPKAKAIPEPAPMPTPPPRALPIEPEQTAPAMPARAIPVEPEILRAQPVAE